MNLLHFLPKDLNEKSLIREEDLLCPLNSKGTTGNLSSFTSYFQSESHISSWAQGQAVSSGLCAFSPPCLHIPPRVHRTQPLPLLCTSLPWHPPYCPVLVSHRNPSPCVLKKLFMCPTSTCPSRQIFFWLVQKKALRKICNATSRACALS